MTPTRPEGVPSNAVCIQPGQNFGPGVGVQQATIVSIEAATEKLNANALGFYAQGLKDWATNAEIYQSLGMDVPPPPHKPTMYTVEVVYADATGTVIPPPAGADGTHYAWTWNGTK